MKQDSALITRKYEQTELGLTIEVTEEILNEIKSAALHHYPKEFGGIFLGRYECGNKVAVVEKMLLPIKYRNTRVHFERGAEKLNDRIEKEFEMSNGKTIYIGEWHSHPDARAIPSGTDVASISEIANTQTVMIENPILLIVSISKEIFEPIFYVFSKNKIYRYEKMD